MGYRHNGVNTGGLPIEYIKNFINKLHVPIFIETGTAGGESIIKASELFKVCHTIEIVEDRVPKFDPQNPEKGGRIFAPNIDFHTGDSGKLLKSIVSKYPNDWIFFWLDAHWSEPHEAPEGTDECPILKEIDSIDHAKSIIMIDDARLFLGPVVWPCDPTRWPKFKDVFIHLNDKFPNHIISVIDDYIVCIPQELKDEFFNEWRGRFEERYPNDETRLRNAVKLAFNAFKNYIQC